MRSGCWHRIGLQCVSCAQGSTLNGATNIIDDRTIDCSGDWGLVPICINRGSGEKDIILVFRMGCHSLPNVSGRWARVPRAQRLCLHCAQQVIGDERHLVFECPVLQFLRDRYRGLFGADIVTMQQFMWQLDIVGVAHFVMDCFDYLDAASSSNQP
jgi:hypothetical protein